MGNTGSVFAVQINIDNADYRVEGLITLQVSNGILS
jgi:hypothetical protein